MAHYHHDLEPEDAQAEAFRIMTEAGITAEVSAPVGAVDKPDHNEGKPWPHLAYTVSFSKERMRAPVVLAYKIGIGHVKREFWQRTEKQDGFAVGQRVRLTVDEWNAARRYCVAGRTQLENFLAPAAAKIASGYKLSLIRPQEVLACYCEESLEASETPFEEWAENLGFDADSRKAEKIYNECRDSLPRMLSLLSRENVERMAELRRMF